MNRLMFEGRFLINITASMIRQDDLHMRHNRLDWERVFRLADYHKVSNMVYLGMLGNGEAVPERWRNRFFERYQEALQYGENCDEAEKEILVLFDMKEVPCILLSAGGMMRNLYQIKETSGNSALQILTDTESYSLAKGYLVDLGYETDRIFPEAGERMKRVSGISVELYYKLPFRTLLYRKQMTRLLEGARLFQAFHTIRGFTPEDGFVYRMAQAAYHYVCDELTVREVLDLMLYHRSCRENFNEEAVAKRLVNFRVDDLTKKILRIAYIWFGSKEENCFKHEAEDLAAYDILENRLLSGGVINKEGNEQAIFLEKLIQQDLDKEKRSKKWAAYRRKLRKGWNAVAKKLRWGFPDYRYMCAIYPILEKIPVLLPIFWIMRGIRMLVRRITDSFITR